MSMSEVIALNAVIAFLRTVPVVNLLTPVVACAAMVHLFEAWRGPFGADQDIQLAGAALEIKTSVANAFEHLMIASERQLDVNQDLSLALMALSLDARPNSGETLSEMVQGMKSVADDSGCLQLLEERLIVLGYEDSERYSEMGYSLRTRRQFSVQTGFPRIVSADLMAGVSNVRYSVAVAACVDFELADQELVEILEGQI